MDEISLISPATVSNVVCGFDCLGFALDGPHDEMTVRQTASSGISIVHKDSYGLPTEPNKNVAAVALQALIDVARPNGGFELEIMKRIKPGSGIGSSAASACGAVVGANRLLGDPFSQLELVEFAMAGEMLASGSRHADNLAPCIYGGFTVVRSSDPLDIVPIDFPELFATVIHPQIEIKTSEARAILPKEVPLYAAIENWSNLAAFIAALMRGDHDIMARSMVDHIVEPVRSPFIPKFNEIRTESLAAGAIGGGISGSGPSMFMLSASDNAARAVEAAMRCVYEKSDIEFHTYVSAISTTGVRFV
ncbi:MAG: homoserine kinase [Pyrinomonadaceae bacterium]